MQRSARLLPPTPLTEPYNPYENLPELPPKRRQLPSPDIVLRMSSMRAAHSHPAATRYENAQYSGALKLDQLKRAVFNSKSGEVTKRPKARYSVSTSNHFTIYY